MRVIHEESETKRERENNGKRYSVASLFHVDIFVNNDVAFSSFFLCVSMRESGSGDDENGKEAFSLTTIDELRHTHTHTHTCTSGG